MEERRKKAVLTKGDYRRNGDPDSFFERLRAEKERGGEALTRKNGSARIENLGKNPKTDHSPRADK